MGTLFILNLAFVISILLAELLLWRFCHLRAATLVFPHETDESYFAFFSIKRLTFVAIAHALLLCLIVTSVLWTLW